jgi:hypothetical protein
MRWACEYRLTADPGGTVEGISFGTTTGMNDFAITAIAIKPSG